MFTLRLLSYPFKRKIRNFLISISVLIFIHWYSGTSVQKFECPLNLLTKFNDSAHIDCIKERGLKSIQFLTDYCHTGDTWGFDGLGKNPFKGCQENRCFAFRYRDYSLVPSEKSDAVLVHVPDLLYIPSRTVYNRNRRQLWSFFTMESQQRSFCMNNRIDELDDWFNLTMTIKNDFSYFMYDLKQLDRSTEYHNALMNSKKSTGSKKLVFWIVSNCKTPSKRERLVSELEKYIEIDIYGGCSHFNNSKPDPCRKSSDPNKCWTDLFSQYKFYLSFENSNCDSYISEKYFKIYYPDTIFSNDLIPVVRGAKKEDYLKRAPSNHSFVFAGDFPTAKSLADYLVYLDRNETAYLEYLAWKNVLIEKIRQKDTKEWFKPVYLWPACELCEKLHDETFMNGQNPVINISEMFNPFRDCEPDPDYTEKEFYDHNKKCYEANKHRKVPENL